MYVTDARHSAEALEHGDRVPSPARRLAVFIKAITLQAARFPPKDIRETSVPCRRRPQHRACPGRIHAENVQAAGEILWHCRKCGDHGLIHHWKEAGWTNARASEPEARSSIELTKLEAGEISVFCFGHQDVADTAVTFDQARTGTVLRGSPEQLRLVLDAVRRELEPVRLRTREESLRGVMAKLEKALRTGKK